MKIEDIYLNSKKYTINASNSARQLSFSGFAVIWIFKVQIGNYIHIDKTLITVSLFLTLSLSFDLIQYVYGYASYWILARYREIKKIKCEDKNYPYWISVPIDILFIAKISCVFFGYYFLINFLMNKII